MSFDLKIKNGDIVVGRTGDIDIVFDNEKLKQDVIKILLTGIGENKFHTYYGSAIGSLDIGSIPDQAIIEMDMTTSAEESIRNLMRLQSSQGRSQFLTPGEQIIEILGVEAVRDQDDPRSYNVYVSLLTRKLTNITESVVVKIA
tara:strand:- start:606 stop:1037 length:432 start_codon:yes stop_codon:yes gene_type:complete